MDEILGTSPFQTNKNDLVLGTREISGRSVLKAYIRLGISRIPKEIRMLLFV